MSAKLFFLPYTTATVNGIAQPGAQLEFLQTGTLTPLPTYTTSALSVEHPSPVPASGSGRFPDIYIDSAQTYRLRVLDKLGAELDDIDPYIPGTIAGYVFDETKVTPQQFGAVADGVTDDSAAFVAAIAHLKSIAVNNDGNIYKGSPRLFVPAGLYNMGTTTLDITHTLIIEGEGSINGYNSRLSWSGDCDGIRIQAYNTSGAATVDGPHFAGSYTILRGLGLVGPYVNNTNFTGHTEGEYHAVNVRSNIIIEDCLMDGWAGDGVHAFTSTGGGTSQEGNSNCSFINRIKVTNVRNGVFIDGGDSNAWTLIGVIGQYCRRWTVWDSSFLGNTHLGHHSANAGIVRGVSPCIVSYSGNRYAVVAGQATGAATNAPSGTTADNAYWLYLAAGAADATLNIPTWSNPTTVREGGCYLSDNIAGASTFVGCYNEGGEGPGQFASTTCVVSGLWGTRNPVMAGNWYGGYRCDLYDFKLVPQSDPSTLENGMMWTAAAGDKIKTRLSGASVNLLTSANGIVNGGSLGYGAGVGAAVTQLTNKSTATPAINKVCGTVTMNNAALAGGAKVSFVVTNSTVASTDTVLVSVASGGTANAYRAAVTAISAGVSFTVTVENITAGSLSEAPVINFSIIKAVAA